MSTAGPIGRDELERLYQRFGASILRRAQRILGDEQLARDRRCSAKVEISARSA